ncbi:antiviral reverse transcriptase Drt3a [Pseudomonas sp. DC3000-4b1]|uniref:antiviral reverse transcriptase Drt3a n=1 Tax=unclassified Pseudomonas TaxID=196821 RepID=UPI003CEF4C83
MYDQSFTLKTVRQELRKSDFIKSPRLRSIPIKEQEIDTAVYKAQVEWDIPHCLTESTIKGKRIFSPKTFSDELLLRKINRNLQKNFNQSEISRDSVVANLRELLREGIDYRIYRLDIKSFYESVDHTLIKDRLHTSLLTSVQTKKFVGSIVEAHALRGLTGVPRGLALSATLAEIIMADFDNLIKNDSHVRYYGRYVDDIIIITDKKERAHRFITYIQKSLPNGFELNRSKQAICETNGDVKPHKNGTPATKEIDFEYLGYRFQVRSPILTKMKPSQHYRDVKLDIAHTKVKKTKTRIAKALLAYILDRDFDLLLLRLKFLCSNFSVMDADRDRKRMAGIYFNYHRIDGLESESLIELDRYLIKIISSGRGRISSELHSCTTLSQRRILLRISFLQGFLNKTFLHFSQRKIGELQRCWKYA